eukprot:tig00021537_g22290.t1
MYKKAELPRLVAFFAHREKGQHSKAATAASARPGAACSGRSLLRDLRFSAQELVEAATRSSSRGPLRRRRRVHPRCVAQLLPRQRPRSGVPYGSTRAPLWQATQSLCALFGEQHSHWAPAIRTDCDGPSTPASIRRGAMRLHLTHLRERGRPGTGLPGQSVAGTGEPPGTARTSDLSILSP